MEFIEHIIYGKMYPVAHAKKVFLVANLQYMRMRLMLKKKTYMHAVLPHHILRIVLSVKMIKNSKRKNILIL